MSDLMKTSLHTAHDLQTARVPRSRGSMVASGADARELVARIAAAGGTKEAHKGDADDARRLWGRRPSSCGARSMPPGDNDDDQKPFDWWARVGAGASWVRACNAADETPDGADKICVRLEDGGLAQLAPDGTALERANPRALDLVPDLAMLEHGNEPAAAHVVARRFAQDAVYTALGPVLLAVNPHRTLADTTYSDQTLCAWQSTTPPEREPHVWCLARAMSDALAEEQCTQVALVTGVSGAGKTETARLLTRFFTSRGSRRRPDGMAAAIMAAEPLLEAFGNATTRLNDNSSRIGTYTSLLFERGAEHHAPVGAEISIHLADVSRVAKTPAGERTFHAFLQLLSADEASLRARGVDPAPSRHLYLARSGAFETPSINDLDALQATNRAMRAIGLSAEQTEHVWDLVVAVLLLGDVTFVERSADDEAACVSDAGAAALGSVAALLGTDVAQLGQSLLRRRPAADNTVGEAEMARDSLAELVYEHLLHWLVARINDACRPANTCSVSAHRIGVLDMPGFENFDAVHGNGIGQLMINYADECVHKVYNDVLFRHEQMLYFAEGIKWPVAGRLPDNASLLNAFETTATPSILSLLHEQSCTSSGSDSALLQKLCSCRLVRGQEDTFVLQHCAGRVTYNVAGMVDANRGCASTKHRAMLQASTRPFVRQVAAAADTPVQTGVRMRSNSMIVAATSPRFQATAVAPDDGTDHPRTAGVAKRFAASLHALMAQLTGARTHFVRCISPNDAKTPRAVSIQHVCDQLRAAGVCTALQLARNGWPVRMDRAVFERRYVPPTMEPGEFLDRFDAASWCRGKSYMFFKTALIDRLVADRRARMATAAARIQQAWRRTVLARRARVLAVLRAGMRAAMARQRWMRARALRVVAAAADGWLCRRAVLVALSGGGGGSGGSDDSDGVHQLLAENARLRAELATRQHALERERDEARAERDQLRAQVARLRDTQPAPDTAAAAAAAAECRHQPPSAAEEPIGRQNADMAACLRHDVEAARETRQQFEAILSTMRAASASETGSVLRILLRIETLVNDMCARDADDDGDMLTPRRAALALPHSPRRVPRGDTARTVPDGTAERCLLAGEVGGAIEAKLRTLCHKLPPQALACQTCSDARARIETAAANHRRQIAQERQALRAVQQELAALRRDADADETLLGELNEELVQLRGRDRMHGEQKRELREQLRDVHDECVRLSQVLERVYAVENSILAALPEAHPLETLVTLALRHNEDYATRHTDAPGSDEAEWYPSGGVLLSRMLFFMCDDDVRALVGVLCSVVDESSLPNRTLRERCYAIETLLMVNSILRQEVATASTGRRAFYTQLCEVTNAHARSALGGLCRWLCDACCDTAYDALTPRDVTSSTNITIDKRLLLKLREYHDDMARYRLPRWVAAQVMLQLSYLIDTACFNRYMRASQPTFTVMHGLWLTLNIPPLCQWLVAVPLRPLVDRGVDIHERRMFSRCNDLARIWQHANKDAFADPDILYLVCHDLSPAQAAQALRIHRHIAEHNERPVAPATIAAVQALAGSIGAGAAAASSVPAIGGDGDGDSDDGASVHAPGADAAAVFALYHIPCTHVFSLRYAYSVDLTVFSAMAAQPAWIEWFHVNVSAPTVNDEHEAMRNTWFARTDSGRAMRSLARPSTQ